MAITRIVETNNTPEQTQKVLKGIACVMEKILYEKYGSVKVELYYSTNNRRDV